MNEEELEFGPTPIEIIKTMSGLAFLKGIKDNQFAQPTIHKTFDFRLVEIDHGKAVFAGVPHQAYLNPLGTVHGSYITALLDSALACAVHSTCDVGYASTSVELKINFVRPVTVQTGRLFARGQVVHPGRKIATSQARLEDEKGKLFAHGTQTCALFEL